MLAPQGVDVTGLAGRARPGDRRHLGDRPGQAPSSATAAGGDLCGERRRAARRAGLRAVLRRRRPNVVTPDLTLGAGAERARAGPGRRERAGGGRCAGPAAASSTAGRSARSSRCATGSCPSSTARSTATPTTSSSRFRDLMPASALDAVGRRPLRRRRRGTAPGSPGGSRSTPRSIRAGGRRGLAAARRARGGGARHRGRRRRCCRRSPTR